VLTIIGHKRNANQNHIRIATFKNTNNRKCWQGGRPKGTLICLKEPWECQPVQPLWKAVWRLLKKLKIDSYDPSIPLLGIYLEECVSVYNKDTCKHLFIAALFIIAKL
jgi:hypothetical protein